MEDSDVDVIGNNEENLDSSFECDGHVKKRKMSEESEHSESDSDRTSSVSSFDNTDDIGECFDWPFAQQAQNSIFNDVSDVLADGSRLSKEINKLLKLVAENDKQDIPPFVGPQPPPWGEGPLPSKRTEQLDSKEITPTAPAEVKTDESKGTIGAPPVHPMPMFQLCVGNSFLPAALHQLPSTLNLSNQWGYPSQVLMNHSDTQVNLSSLNNPSYESVKANGRIERQQRRREKNRECSRMFRVKQRVKEDALKRGKLDKEVSLQRCLIEGSRLRMALQGLQQNDRICPAARRLLEFPVSQAEP